MRSLKFLLQKRAPPDWVISLIGRTGKSHRREEELRVSKLAPKGIKEVARRSLPCRLVNFGTTGGSSDAASCNPRRNNGTGRVPDFWPRIYANRKMCIRCKEGHLALSVTAILTIGISVDQLANRQPIRHIFCASSRINGHARIIERIASQAATIR